MLNIVLIRFGNKPIFIKLDSEVISFLMHQTNISCPEVGIYGVLQIIRFVAELIHVVAYVLSKDTSFCLHDNNCFLSNTA